MASAAPPPTGPAPGNLADRLEREVLARIAPEPELLREVASVRDRLIARVTEEAGKRSIPVRRALVAGSAARGTFLRERLDIDLFLLFSPDLPRADLEQYGLQLAGAILESSETRYAEHPYLRGRFAGFTVDAVPGYAIEDPSRPITAVDRTPFHQQFLAERLTPDLVDQVRLTKQFLRAIGISGSEARTAGFSGYLVELLVIRFGSLRALLQAARGWRVPVRLAAPASRPTVPDDVALILDDPVDPHRNVASALSRENLALFILAAHEYLQRPRLEAFFPSPRPRLSMADARARVASRGTHVAVARMARPSLVDDILYPQLRKAERALAAEAERLGFVVLGSASTAGLRDLWIALEAESGSLPAVRVQDGPPPGVRHTDAFLEKWTAPAARVSQGPYLRPDGRLAADAVRAERAVERLLADELGGLALGKDLRVVARREAWVRPIEALPQTPELEELLDRLLNKRLPWLPTLPL